jgi:hypothetical protein
VIAYLIQQEFEVNRQRYLEAQAALISMLGALAQNAPPYFKTVEELHAWVRQPISSEAADGSVRRIDVRTCLLTWLQLMSMTLTLTFQEASSPSSD